MNKQDIESVAKAERNKYARQWRAKNKDRVKATNQRYWIKRAINHLAESCPEVEHEQ